ncbi:glutaredoxin-dependent arsenate reductase [Rhodanobacter denitrificans]|jgi:arsenate reductase (glutaredoxin)|uniref:Arsenate reductase n=3 Tax=Rhodanobacter TaxID=75309 RepID=M4NDQ0_9GAMM|nr:glutaredoxin-dependent arsenate reductase [Rhodanobacter denitrificans]
MNTTTPMTATIYHNPDCGTSRNTLALIRHAGIEPTVIEYLRTPPSRKQLTKLIDEAMLKPREALREKGTPFAELGLDEAGITDDVIIDAMLQHPILINRPFVVTPRGTRLCRPSEVVLNILPPNLQPFTKEDGEVVVGREPLAIFPDADPR